MQYDNKRWFKVVVMGFVALFLLSGSRALAQDSSLQLFITGTDVSTLPSIELHVYGLDGEGNPLDLAQTAFSIQHNKLPVAEVEYAGTHTAGTFTVFLIDVPEGVSDQLPAIQNAIIQYASSPTMMEQIDQVAVYQVGASEAVQLLAADTFYNGVRNLFASPITPESGPTALVDSIMGLVEQMEDLKPRSDMTASLVVITDGTDVVSTQHDPGDLPRLVSAAGVPIHTIWLDNAGLSAPSKAGGQEFLADVATSSRGLSGLLENSSDLTDIWDRIVSFRDQARIRYTIDEISVGDFPVELVMTGSPATRAETSVTIPGNTPTVVLNIPPESRSLTLPSLEDPVKLRLSASVSWLDGNDRALVAAQLTVNGMSPQNVPVESIAEFEIDVDNLIFGSNTVQITVMDEQNFRVESPAIVLTITEGSKSLPEEVEPAPGFWATLFRVLLTLFVLAVVAAAGFFAWRQGWLERVPELIPRGRSRRGRKGQPMSAAPPAAGQRPPPGPATGKVLAHLEVLEAISHTPPQIPLSGAHMRIGRSPIQSNIAFENDITVSRIHASLMLEGSHYRIFDEQSTSGTWVNEQQVPEYGIQLIDGDEIHLGAVHLRFRQPAAKPAS